MAKALEPHFDAAVFDVTYSQTISQARALNQLALFNVIILFLMSMAILLAVVGAIGLTGAMGLNVIERIREVGVMRAIGASTGSVLQVFLVEGVLIGLMSWLAALLLALPVGKLISTAVGMETMGNPLSYVVSPTGILIWLGLAVLLGPGYLFPRPAGRRSQRAASTGV